MNLATILSILLLTLFISQVENKKDDYQEDLFIRPLTDGKLYTQFRFKTSYRSELRQLRWENKIQIFPLSIADLVAATDLNELHFSLTKGNWKYREWGYSTRPSPPGAQIRVQFSQHSENQDRSWNRLVNSLAGKFCASLSTANENSIVRSTLAFSELHNSLASPSNSSNYIYVNLPEETFCTENLTPWRKLLPCYQDSGLSTLLNAVKLLESSYSSLAIDLEPSPGKVELIQTLTVVFNPLEQFEGKQMWSLTKIFGNDVSKPCPVASRSAITVDLANLDDRSKLYPQAYTLEGDRYAVFDVNAILARGNTQLNVGIKQTQLFKRPPASSRPTLPVYLNTHVAGLGAADGTIVATITNRNQEAMRITFMDTIPHFLRLFLHTLSIRTTTGHELKYEQMNFRPSTGTNPSLIEFSLIVPPNSETRISYDFERAFLRWSDYKPDANKGVLISSAQMSFAPPSDCEYSDRQCSGRIYARPLLVILPTPDFSMPYNVICLVSTVLVAAFGPLHSMTTTKPVIKVNKKDTKKNQ